MPGKEEVVFAKLEVAAGAATEEDGADVIIIGSATMHQSHAHLAAHLPVPVISPGLLAYKVCERWIELGITHSKRAFPSPARVQDEALFPRR